ncbi:MAG TPA: PqqD family protein [Blastocatellia bacterium]|nr:PqqD family protein [Blastocatellia bacterium]
MAKRVEQPVPQARKDGLVVKELPGEVLVYDLERHKAHCLNQTAMLVWSQCDGRATVTDMIEAVQAESGLLVDEDVVWLALDQLDKARLLQGRISRPSEKPRLSRRDAVRRIGIAAAVPLVLSIVAPTALAVGTCLGTGEACTDNAQCCSGICSGAPNGLCT